MFGLFKKSNAEKLERAYQEKLEHAMHAQRNGDIKGYSLLSEEADNILKKLDAEKKRVESSR